MKEFAASDLVRTVVSHLPDSGGRFVARAPGRLDIMGASAVHCGSLTISVPLEWHACVAVSLRDDGKISVSTRGHEAANGHTPFMIESSALGGTDQELDAASGKTVPGGPAANRSRRTVQAVLSAATAMHRAGFRDELKCGMSVVVGISHDACAGVGRAAATAAGVIAAAMAAWNRPADEKSIDLVTASLPPAIGELAISAADVYNAFYGQSQRVTQVRNDPTTLVPSLKLPDGLTFVGIDCGVVNANACEKYWQMRTTVGMGRELLSRIIEHDCPEHARWEGYLSRISATDFVARFRDRIPTRIRGRDYLDKFGPLPLDIEAVDPDGIYKVRSRTEHHIYEHARALQFAQQISRSTRNQGEDAIHELGELMYASHWSYGQRCGLGSIHADKLVSLLRARGTDSGILGAKISGAGCGGTVAVFMRGDEQGHRAVHEAVEAYNAEQDKHGQRATVIPSSSVGLMDQGVFRL